MKLKIKLTLFAAALFFTSLAQQSKEEKHTGFDEDWAFVNYSIPLFIDSNYAKNDIGKNVIYSSIITPFSPAIQPTYFFSRGLDNHPKEGKRSFGYIANLPIKRTLQILYGEHYFWDSLTNIRFPLAEFPSSRIEFRNIDSVDFVYKINDERHFSHLYTTQFTCSRQDIPVEAIKNEMVHMIERNFGIKTYLEQQTKICIIIKRNNLPIPDYKEGEVEYQMGVTNGRGRVSMNKVPFKQFVNFMNTTFKSSNFPIVDETGFTGHLGQLRFETEGELNFEKMQKHLAPFGLELTKENREVDILIIENNQPAGRL